MYSEKFMELCRSTLRRIIAMIEKLTYGISKDFAFATEYSLNRLYFLFENKYPEIKKNKGI
jgi:hypothetical protein